MHTCNDKLASRPSDLDLHEHRGRKRQATSTAQPHQTKRKRTSLSKSMDMTDSIIRPLRSSSRTRSAREKSVYTASINSVSTSSLIKLTSATTLTQSSTRSGSKSPSRARSRSPAKTVLDLQNADPPTIYLQMRHPNAEIPASVRDLNNNVTRAGRSGNGLLPGSIRVYFPKALYSASPAH